jgi:hypothetical protein
MHPDPLATLMTQLTAQQQTVQQLGDGAVTPNIEI